LASTPGKSRSIGYRLWRRVSSHIQQALESNIPSQEYVLWRMRRRATLLADRAYDSDAWRKSSIAEMSSTTSISLHAFLQTSHERMPILQLTQTEVDDVVAYILRLKGK
jgi:hypothetical protein